MAEATPSNSAAGRLLLIGRAEESARSIESFLRNARHPLRCAWSNDPQELLDVLQRSPPDALLIDESHPVGDSATIIRQAHALRPELPVLIVGAVRGLDAVTTALSIGAKDYVSSHDQSHLRHLELVLVRELAHHRHNMALRLTRARLADFEARHNQLLEGSSDAIAYIREGIIAQINLPFSRLLSAEDGQILVGQPLIDCVSEDQRVRVKERLRQVLKGKHQGDALEFNLLGKGGQPVPVSAQLILGNEDGEQLIEMLVRPLPPAVETAMHGNTLPGVGYDTVPLARIGQTAAISGGRTAFLRAIASLDAQGQGPHGVLVIAVDHFAALEERIGLTHCEEVMSQLQAAIKERLGPTDQIFAFSSSETGLVVTRSQISEIEALGKMLRQGLSEQIFTTREHEAQLSFSIVVYPLAGGEKADQVVTESVREVRRLSEKSGNQLSVLGSAAQANQNEREQTRKAAMVKKALEDNRLKLAYQSIASLEGDSRQHFDVLVRMMDENGKELHASEFLPAAEKFGLMRSIDRWVLARTLALVAKRTGGAGAPSLFVKVSEDSLRDAEAYVNWIGELFKTYPLKQEEFVFEIPEAVIQNHVRKAKGITLALGNMGAGIAIDHFGISTHSVQMLEQLPKISYVKFHASFTQKFNDKEAQRRLTHLVEIAKQKKIKTIVSHVEDANVMARLWQIGVNYIQGYHVQEPEVMLLNTQFVDKALSIHAVR